IMLIMDLSNVRFSLSLQPFLLTCFTLSLHDALPIFKRLNRAGLDHLQISIDNVMPDAVSKKSLKVLDKKLQLLSEHLEAFLGNRSEEHTSELQSRGHLVCRLLLEKKNIEERIVVMIL